jgi:hypothetical protein
MGELERMTQFREKAKLDISLQAFSDDSLINAFRDSQEQMIAVNHFVDELRSGKINIFNLRTHLEMFINLRNVFAHQQ